VSRIVSALVLVVSALRAQVFIVDAGGGGHFTDLPAAIAAVPDGSTLRVRAGSYSPFTVQGKGVRILGEGLVTLARVPGDVVIDGTQREQVVLLRKLSLEDVPTVSIRDCGGPVVLEWCSAVDRGPNVTVTESANVQLLRCTIRSQMFPLSFSPIPPDRMSVTASSILVAGCSIEGWSRGRDGHGQHGVHLVGSRAVVIASTLAGGAGAAGFCFCFRCFELPGLDGGHGCVVEHSTLYSLASSVVGGPGGPGGQAQNCGTCSCYGTPPGTRGQGIQELGASTVSIFWSGALCEVLGEQATGSQVAFATTVTGTPPFLATMLFSYRGDLLPIAPPLGHGVLLAAPVGILAPFSSSSRTLQLPWNVPQGLQPGFAYFGQFVLLDASGLIFGNPFPFVVSR
jgi:hypothetical protein